ncbi:unnamed protein product [Euphydryas editha]|uniref:FP protein C-terminal domain-containing protein n=1 Tax=Euphydryas editha TaxID=104508 RepID=A0AAU9UFS0_EUPED|nr:unnamed protein product [Euphydryas editha]
MQRSPNNQHGSGTNTGVTQRKTKRRDDSEFQDTFQDFKDEIRRTLHATKNEIGQEIKNYNQLLLQDIKENLDKLTTTTEELRRDVAGITREFSVIKEEFTSLRASVEFASNQYDDINKKLSLFSNDIKKIEALEIELQDIKNQHQALEAIINTNDQRDRLLNLEFVGIPESKDENLNDLTVKIAQAANVTINISDIVQVNRISPRVKIQGRPRTVVVKFQSRLIKENILSGARKNRISTKSIHLPGNPVPIFVNEHLTPYNKILLKKLKDYAKNKEIQYVWTKNGRLYMRKNNLSPAVQIQKEQDFIKRNFN